MKKDSTQQTPLTPEELACRLTHLLTSYDSKRSKRKDYNHYALGHYLKAADLALKLVQRKRVSWRTALSYHFAYDTKAYNQGRGIIFMIQPLNKFVESVEAGERPSIKA